AAGGEVRRAGRAGCGDDAGRGRSPHCSWWLEPAGFVAEAVPMMVRALVAALMLGGCATTAVPAPAAETGALVDRYDEAVLRAIMADLAYAVVDTSENA